MNTNYKNLEELKKPLTANKTYRPIEKTKAVKVNYSKESMKKSADYLIN